MWVVTLPRFLVVFNRVMVVDTLMKYKTKNIHFHNKTMCTKFFREQKTALF